jgi:hypothetical protein
VLLALVYVSLWVKQRVWDARDAELKVQGKFPADLHDAMEGDLDTPAGAKAGGAMSAGQQ